ncbi:helix-turn-helix domain-containing protein [Nocardiopsis exhalans]|uniref:Helix-turn-helix domain-containing protein n=1 Tax=Nocardiopsis exhalans TaxID=163604 RepID=A0ABY5DEE3_9ACTN|nr:helix-turn-helix domain-containing protein [Nocardiopsis exhalans]USY21433.1 helix-turn-helix domain-containing protein [Nocardiopsis exhalans]
MPGGRLGQEERERIEAGLARGASYSEMARELDRPVSTVTREIGRNGGVSAYRADRAQEAAVRRARRRGAAAPRKPHVPRDLSDHGRDPEAVQEFRERLAALLVKTGLPRLMSRVLVCLYTSDAGALTTAELVKLLGISPASVSKAVGYLEEQELLSRERVPGSRAERYMIGEDVWYRSMMASARSNSKLAEAAGEGALTLGLSTPAGARLEEMNRFLWHTGADLARAAELWQQFPGADNSSPGATGPGGGRTGPGRERDS